MDAKTVIWAAEPVGSQAAELHRFRMEMNRLAAENGSGAVLLPLAPLHIPLALQPADRLPEGFGFYSGPGPRLRAAALPGLACSGLRADHEKAWAVFTPETPSPACRPLRELQELILRELPGSSLPDRVPNQSGAPETAALCLGTWSEPPASGWIEEFRNRSRDLCGRLPLLSGMQLTASLVNTPEAGAAAQARDTTLHLWQQLYTAPLRRYLHSH